MRHQGAGKEDQVLEERAKNLEDLLRHVVERVIEGYSAARISCTVPEHLKSIYYEFSDQDK